MCYDKPCIAENARIQKTHESEAEIKRRPPKKFKRDLRYAYRINREIQAPQVRLIGPNREHIGIVSLQEALEQARKANLDLVEISPSADPPVVRIVDYGKFIYEQTKKEREARRSQKLVEVKEIRLRPKTDDHDRAIKVRDARRWLEEGMKVKVRVRFRGREITYPELAMEQLQEVAKELADIAVVEQAPNMEGQTMLMILAPKPKKASGGQQSEVKRAEDQNP
ncbi:MAG: translation initiation factor IF-3 [Anaerolineae bacterium]